MPRRALPSGRQQPTRTSQSLTQRLKGFVLQEPAVRERHSFRSQLYWMYDGRPFHWTEWRCSFDFGLDVRVTPLERQFRLGTVPSVKSDDVLLLGQEADVIIKYVLQMPSLRRFPLEIGARFFH